MPNIIFINVALGFGSTGRIVEQTALLAEKHGYHCSVVHSARYGRKSSILAYQTGTVVQEKIHAIESFLFDAHGYGSRNETKKIIEFIESERPNIIHIHNLHGYYINYRILFEYIIKKNIPVIWTMHDYWMLTGHCTYSDYIGCDKWKTQCCQCPLKSSYPKALIDRSKQNFRLKNNLFRATKDITLVPVSYWIGDVAKESFLSNCKMKVIHNGIDLNVFRPSKSNIKEKLGIPVDKFIVLGVANHFGKRKGYSDFVKLNDLIPEIQIIIVGASAKEIENAPIGIIAIGRTESQQKLVDLYSCADVYVNPTYEDNFPTTNLEALACGTPVITYQTGGSPEAIDDETGIIVEKGNVNQLVEAILEIQKKGKLHYSEKCRQRAELKFNKDERFMDYIKLYDEIINKQ